MDLDKIPAGIVPPWDINVIVEIPMRGDPVEYKIDPNSGGVYVGRFLHTSMVYPCNYGFIPHTLSRFGDPLEVAVVASTAVLPGAILRSRPVGLLVLTDEAGVREERVLAVPVDRLHPFYAGTTSYRTLPTPLLQQVTHFFQHVRDIESARTWRDARWGEADEAAQYILDGLARKRAQSEGRGEGAGI